MENDEVYKNVYDYISKIKYNIHTTITAHALEARKMAAYNNSEEIDGIL